MTEETLKLIHFISKFKNLQIIMKVIKRAKSDGITEEGKKIEFRNWVYATSNQEIIDFLKSHMTFGSDFWINEKPEVSENMAKDAPQIGIQTMPSDAEVTARQNMVEERFKKIEDSVNKMNENFGKLLEALKSKETESKK